MKNANFYSILFYSILFYSILFSQIAFGQVKIGDNPTTIDTDALLELESQSKGLLMVRIPLVETTNPAPLQNHVAGMTVYNTQTMNDVEAGNMYYNDGTQWLKICTTCGQETSPCITPSAITIFPTNPCIEKGDSTVFTIGGGLPNTNISWTITPTIGVSQTSGTSGVSPEITFDSSGTYTITFTATNTNNPAVCSPGTAVSGTLLYNVIESSAISCSTAPMSITTTGASEVINDITVGLSSPTNILRGPYSGVTGYWLGTIQAGSMSEEITFTLSEPINSLEIHGAAHSCLGIDCEDFELWINGTMYTITAGEVTTPIYVGPAVTISGGKIIGSGIVSGFILNISGIPINNFTIKHNILSGAPNGTTYDVRIPSNCN